MIARVSYHVGSVVPRLSDRSIRHMVRTPDRGHTSFPDNVIGDEATHLTLIVHVVSHPGLS